MVASGKYLCRAEVLLDKEELNGYCQEAYGLQETLRINRSNWVVPIGTSQLGIFGWQMRKLEPESENMWAPFLGYLLHHSVGRAWRDHVKKKTDASK